MRTIYIFLALVSLTVAEVAVISEPIPGQEYVFVKTSQSEAHPISRKDKNVDAAGRPFETAHKVPENLRYKEEKDVEQPTEVKSKVKRQAPAPPGSMKIDVQKLLEKYKDNSQPKDAKELVYKYRSEIEASTTKAPASRTSPKAPASRTTTTTTKAPETPKPKRGRSRSRQKKEAPVATTPNPILTTGAPSTPRTLKIRDANGAKDEKPTENKRSRIQIKKGPNGQEYEYEYVYYYYDDDEEDNKSKVTNSHDGPARNTIGRSRPSSTTAHPEPAANEVVPSTRGTRGRGRQLNHEVPEEKVPEEKLPLNTRFPPRGRNINTTPTSVEEDETKTQRPRGRRPQAQDSTADESQVNGRGRNRANVRRPSLDLVDSASFNTHSSNDPAIEPYKEPKARGEKLKDGPSFPQELPEGPVRFLGATPNEKMDLQELKSRLAENEESSTDSGGAVTTEETVTTEVNGMNKVALDLYAILQGTQKLSGESDDGVTEIDVTTTESSTDETTTDVVTTEEVTTPSTTTTTTTTPAPSTTSTTPEPTGRSKFRRPGGSRFKSAPSTSTTSAPEPSTDKPKGRFTRPGGFGNRPRTSTRVTTEATEQEVTKDEVKSVNAKPSLGNRNRFSGRGRPTASTTVVADTSESTTAAARPGLTRPRPGGFNLRRRGGSSTTKEPSEEGEAASSPSHEEASTTAKPARGRVSGNLPRPALRLGPRINLAARGRPGVPSSTTAAPEGGEEIVSEEVQAEGEEKTGETTPIPSGKGALNLRNRPRLTVNHSRPKQAASTPVVVRRTNPLLRKKPVVTAEASEAAPTEAPAEGATEPAGEEEAPSEAPSSTTEEPRGLNKLLAGRRRLARPSH